MFPKKVPKYGELEKNLYNSHVCIFGGIRSRYQFWILFFRVVVSSMMQRQFQTIIVNFQEPNKYKLPSFSIRLNKNGALHSKHFVLALTLNIHNLIWICYSIACSRLVIRQPPMVLIQSKLVPIFGPTIKKAFRLLQRC